MQKVLHETCEQYVARRLSEGWRIISQIGFNVILQSPEGIIRPVDLRNDVVTLRPNAAGSETALTIHTPNTGEANWQDVDEETQDELNTSLKTASTTYVRDLYNLPASGLSGYTINFIKIYFCCWSTADNYAGIKPSLKSDTTVTDGTEILMTTSWTTYSQQWNTNPADGGAWSWADIDALQIGAALKKNIAVPYFTQVYVEIDYTPAVLPFRSYYPHILAH